MAYNFDDWRGAQGGFHMDWTTNDRDSFTFQGDLYKQEDGERVSISTYVPPFTGNVDGDANLSGGNVLARWTRKLRDGTDLQLQAYYDRTNRYELNLIKNRDADLDFITRTNLAGRQQITYGAGARASDGRFTQVVSGLTFDALLEVDYLFSAFFQDEIGLVDANWRSPPPQNSLAPVSQASNYSPACGSSGPPAKALGLGVLYPRCSHSLTRRRAILPSLVSSAS